MLPEKSLDQLKKLRKIVKGVDINDRVAKDETKLPNLYYMDNPIDGGRIKSYADFTKIGNKKQTTAFKSKLVNKPLVKENISNNDIHKTCAKIIKSIREYTNITNDEYDFLYGDIYSHINNLNLKNK